MHVLTEESILTWFRLLGTRERTVHCTYICQRTFASLLSVRNERSSRKSASVTVNIGSPSDFYCMIGMSSACVNFSDFPSLRTIHSHSLALSSDDLIGSHNIDKLRKNSHRVINVEKHYASCTCLRILAPLHLH